MQVVVNIIMLYTMAEWETRQIIVLIDSMCTYALKYEIKHILYGNRN